MSMYYGICVSFLRDFCKSKLKKIFRINCSQSSLVDFCKKYVNRVKY